MTAAATSPAVPAPEQDAPVTRPVARRRGARRLMTGYRAVDRTMPGPIGRPFVGVLPQISREPFESVRGWASEYGDVFHLPMPLWNVVIVNHPDLVNALMNDRTGTFSMIGPLESIAAKAVGAALPMMEGDRFKQRRRTLTPMFGKRHLATIGESIADEFVQRLQRWETYVDSGLVVDLQHEIAQLTLPAFLRAMYSTSLSDAELEQTDKDLRLLLRTMAAGVLFAKPPVPVPLPGVENLPTAWRRLRRLVKRLLDERLADPIEGTDLMQLLIDARYEDGSRLSRKDLAMELIILMAGGYETVVASLSHTLAHLSLNPEPLQRLYDEINALDGGVPTLDDLARLQWAKACFDEGQRLQGHPFHPRIAMRDTELAGFHIPRGALVAVPMYTLQRDERWWPDGDRYDPTRFIDKEIVMARPNLAFIPFGAGPHHCIGSGMAYMNAQFLLALIFQRYRITTPDGWTPKHASTFSTTLEGGLPVTLTRAPGRTRHA
jgi:cytochrome P450